MHELHFCVPDRWAAELGRAAGHRPEVSRAQRPAVCLTTHCMLATAAPFGTAVLAVSQHSCRCCFSLRPSRFHSDESPHQPECITRGIKTDLCVGRLVRSSCARENKTKIPPFSHTHTKNKTNPHTKTRETRMHARTYGYATRAHTHTHTHTH